MFFCSGKKIGNISSFENKTLKNDFKAIKLSIFFSLVLFWAFFVVEGVGANPGFTEGFETYNLGNINYQNNWYPLNKDPAYYEFGFIVTDRFGSEPTPPYYQSIISHPTSTDLFGSSELWYATTTGLGIFSFDFWVDKKPNWAEVEFCYGFISCVDFKIGDYTKESTKIYFKNILLAENYINNVWHRISFEYNLDANWGRASFDFGSWSATTTLFTPAREYFNRFVFRSGGEDLEQIYFDNFTNEGQCDSTCIYCSFNQCLNFETFCSWNEEENQCQVLGLPPEFELEECSGLGITDRLLCEIKNFFYGLFVPSLEKRTELIQTIDLIKQKFPYNYVLAIKDFFIYLKDNINEEQAINFKILGQAGTINLGFWNTTTTLAGVSQSFLTIFKTFFKFLVILIFGFWCFSFLRRIFK